MPYKDPEKRRAHRNARYATDTEFREHAKATSAAYRKANPDRVRETERNRTRDPDAVRAYNKIYSKRPDQRAKARARAAKYRTAHPDRIKDQARAQRVKHGDKYAKRWRARHPDYKKPKPSPEKSREYSARWYAKDPERARAVWRRWQKSHPEKVKAASAKRRATIRGLTEHHTHADIRAQFVRQNGRCFYCDCALDSFEVDHKTPLSRGGSDRADNIVCACEPCNLRKGRKTVEEFLSV